jgi:hypothetical protein
MPILCDRPKSEELVQQLYHQLFGRQPERDVSRGLVAGFMEGRVSVRVQLMTMLKSEEFFAKRLQDKTPEEIALILYRFILTRAPDSPEDLQAAADFVGNLGWRVQVDTMINSEEYLGRYGDDALPGWAPATAGNGGGHDEAASYAAPPRAAATPRPAPSHRPDAAPRPVAARAPWRS